MLELSDPSLYGYKIKRRWSEVSNFNAQLKRLNSDLGKKEKYKVRFADKYTSTLDPGMLDGRKVRPKPVFPHSTTACFAGSIPAQGLMLRADRVMV